MAGKRRSDLAVETEDKSARSVKLAKLANEDLSDERNRKPGKDDNVTGDFASVGGPGKRKAKEPVLEPRDGDGATKLASPDLLDAAGLDSGNISAAEDDVRQISKKYRRGDSVALKHIPDKKLRAKLRAKEKVYRDAAITAAKVEQWLLPSEGGFLEAEGVEHTANFQQAAILKEVDIQSSRKAFDLQLPELGPYVVDYTRNGRHLLIGGRKGHLAITDWKRGALVTEVQVRETVRDVKFLHNEVFFAAAQKKNIFIYDKRGIEIHKLKSHVEPLRLEFLPDHFLLASIGKAGNLVYQDTSTGQVAAQHRTRLGRCSVLRVNPYNAVLALGHSQGVVSMWSPNMGVPLVSMLCHRGPVTAIGIDLLGKSMVTAGLDGQVKVWDLRMLKERHAYFSPSPAHSIDISQRGLLSVAYGSGVQVWKDALLEKQRAPYITHRLFKAAVVEDLVFCPFEDVLGIGHSLGISSILVPGAGEPNFDSFVANPFETKKQRKETEVHRLLEKLQPETIVLDPSSLGTLKRPPTEVQALAQKAQEKANMAAAVKRGKEVAQKRKAKGKSAPSKRHKKKQENVITAKRSKVEHEANKAKQNLARKESERDGKVGATLARFLK